VDLFFAGKFFYTLKMLTPFRRWQKTLIGRNNCICQDMFSRNRKQRPYCVLMRKIAIATPLLSHYLFVGFFR